MTHVDFIYDPDCPNVADARAQLLKAFALAGQQPRWKEWSSRDPAGPGHARHYGSPTILVNGRDVAGAQQAPDAACCRIYENDQGGLRGTPRVEAIAAALNGRFVRPPKSGWKTSLPAVGAIFVPKLICPSCLPALTALLGSIGLSITEISLLVFPLAVALLGVAVFSLAYKARQRHGYGPFYAGFFSGVTVLLSQFHWQSEYAVYLGIAGLIAASVWNAWPVKATCPACAAPAKGELK